MAEILEFPLERTHATAARRRRSRDIDAAIERAEQWHRIHRVSKSQDAGDDKFRLDQVRPT